MDVRAALKGQYRASLAMLREAIERCPEALWAEHGELLPCWQVAYHALFFTDLYLQRDVEAFRPWAQHRAGCEDLSRQFDEPYTKAQVLEYFALCEAMVDTEVDRMDLDRPECGFPWYQLPKLDHQLNNIRHIQHHAAQLGDRLRAAAGAGVDWIGGR